MHRTHELVQPQLDGTPTRRNSLRRHAGQTRFSGTSCVEGPSSTRHLSGQTTFSETPGGRIRGFLSEFGPTPADRTRFTETGTRFSETGHRPGQEASARSRRCRHGLLYIMYIIGAIMLSALCGSLRHCPVSRKLANLTHLVGRFVGRQLVPRSDQAGVRIAMINSWAMPVPLPAHTGVSPVLSPVRLCRPLAGWSCQTRRRSGRAGSSVREVDVRADARGR
jgi:hypothetical protein